MDDNIEWWKGYPWRMVQTNLRETDMEDIDAEKYAQDLQELGATVVLLNAAGIIASYHTKLDFQTTSAYLHGDSLKQIIDACHSHGIRVIARTDFSKVRYELYEKHPEWAYRTEEGNIVNYNGDVHVCPNSEYQREYELEILKEVLSEFPFDGVFCNMSGFLVVDYDYNYYGPCHCENCKTRFKKLYGAEIPSKNDTKSPAFMRYNAFRNKCIKEQKQKIYDTVKSIGKGIAVNGFDYARTESNTDIGRAQWVYSASSNCRITCGPDHDKPADNASVDFIGFQYRDIAVSSEQSYLRHAQSLANAGSLSLYIMGRLDQHRDRTGIEPARKAFAFHKAHEELFAHMKSAAEVLLVRFRPAAYPDPESSGWVRALTESHVPFDEMQGAELTARIRKDPAHTILDEKKVVILGEYPMLPSALVEALDEFVKHGGTVIACGETGFLSDRMQPLGKCSLQCLGVDQVSAVHHDRKSSMFEIPVDSQKEKDLFVRSREASYIMPGRDIVQIQPSPETEGYLKLVGEHPYGPPERCYFTNADVSEDAGLYVTEYGKGKGIYIPWKCGTVYYQEGYENTLHFIRDVLFEAAGIPDIAPELSAMVEVTVNRSEGDLLVQLVNGSGFFGNSYFRPVPVTDIEIRIPEEYCTEKLQTASALNGGKAELKQDKGETVLHLDRLDRYEAVVLSTR